MACIEKKKNSERMMNEQEITQGDVAPDKIQKEKKRKKNRGKCKSDILR
jgi:hypothetical protein